MYVNRHRCMMQFWRLCNFNCILIRLISHSKYLSHFTIKWCLTLWFWNKLCTITDLLQILMANPFPVLHSFQTYCVLFNEFLTLTIITKGLGCFIATKEPWPRILTDYHWGTNLIFTSSYCDMLHQGFIILGVSKWLLDMI